MSRRIYLRAIDTGLEELNKNIEIGYNDDGTMVNLVQVFREFASALGFYDDTIDRFIINQYEYPNGHESLYDLNQ